MTTILMRIGKLPRLQLYMLVFLLGVLAAGAMPPFHLVFILPISFSGLLLVLSGAQNKKQAFFYGWFFGWGYFIAGLYWIGVAFTIDADAHAALIPIPILGLPAFLACFAGVTTLICYLLNAKNLRLILLFSLTWVTTEIIRGYLFTGFPWNNIGYSWFFSASMSQIGALGGMIGLSFLSIFLSCFPYLGVNEDSSRKRNYGLMAVAICLLGLQYGYGTVRLNVAETTYLKDVKLRLVQPNIRQQDKWKRHLRQLHVEKLVALSSGPGIDQVSHIIWPETSVPYFLTTNQKVINYVKPVIPIEGALITGAPRRKAKERRYYNSLQVMTRNGEFTDIYDKQHLVPYGEYMPLRSLLKSIGLFALIPALDNMSDFDVSDNTNDEIISIPNLPDSRGLICYEVAFASEMNKGQPFDWILNLTNDGWFGDTTGPHQHIVHAQARALEQGVPLVRVANTGISALIDPYGRILSRLELNSAGILDVGLPKALPIRPVYSFVVWELEIGFVLLNLFVFLSFRRQTIPR
jgi:apolipoprotein N-acyltransferase